MYAQCLIAAGRAIASVESGPGAPWSIHFRISWICSAGRGGPPYGIWGRSRASNRRTSELFSLLPGVTSLPKSLPFKIADRESRRKPFCCTSGPWHAAPAALPQQHQLGGQNGPDLGGEEVALRMKSEGGDRRRGRAGCGQKVALVDPPAKHVYVLRGQGIAAHWHARSRGEPQHALHQQALLAVAGYDRAAGTPSLQNVGFRIEAQLTLGAFPAMAGEARRVKDGSDILVETSKPHRGGRRRGILLRRRWIADPPAQQFCLGQPDGECSKEPHQERRADIPTDSRPSYSPRGNNRE